MDINERCVEFTKNTLRKNEKILEYLKENSENKNSIDTITYEIDMAKWSLGLIENRPFTKDYFKKQ